MDPDENLREQRALVKKWLAGHISLGEAARLAELVQALDEWMSNGGFLPKAWNRS